MLRACVWLIGALAFGLAVFGVLVISYAGKAQAQVGDPYHFVTMQAMFLAMGVVAAFVLYNLDYSLYRRKDVLWLLAVGMVVLLALVLVPGIGKSVKGAHRWIGLGPINLQPVEFVKLGMVVFVSGYLGRLGAVAARGWKRWKRVRTFGFPLLGLGGPLALLALVCGALVLQPDYGGTAIVIGLWAILLLAGGVPFRWVALCGVVGLIVVAAFVLSNPNRLARLRNEGDGDNYQTLQAEIAFRNGGLTGVGLGRGMQKEHYLPECHTDFIYAVIAEDFGLVATGAIWLAFIVILGAGTVIAFRAPDKQGTLLAIGATLYICAQGAANMAVVTHVLPTKGLALPFLSYGGSCLIATFAAVGVLTGVGRQAIEAEETPLPQGQRIVSL